MCLKVGFQVQNGLYLSRSSSWSSGLIAVRPGDQAGAVSGIQLLNTLGAREYLGIFVKRFLILDTCRSGGAGGPKRATSQPYSARSSAMPGVVESAVIGVPHSDFGEGVTAVVVCNKGAAVNEASVLKGLDGRLAKFKMPKRVFIVDDLPRNAMGKVQKNILRDTYKDIYSK